MKESFVRLAKKFLSEIQLTNSSSMAVAINVFTTDKFLQPGTNFSRQDKPWAEFSTLEVAACHAMHLLHSKAIRPNLELKTRSKQLLGSLPLDILSR